MIQQRLQVLLLLVVAILCQTVVCGENPDSWKTEKSSEGGVTIQLQMPKVITADGPCIVRITITNNSNSDISYIPATEPLSLFTIAVKWVTENSATGGDVGMSPLGKRYFSKKGDRRISKRLPMNSSVSYSVRLDKLFQIGIPGTYSVAVSFQARPIDDPQKNISVKCNLKFQLADELVPAFQEEAIQAAPSK